MEESEGLEMVEEKLDQIVFLLQKILEQQAVATTLLQAVIAPGAPSPPPMPNLFPNNKAKA